MPQANQTNRAALAARARERAARMVLGRSRGYEAAEQWDLEYWQSVTPEDRLRAFMAIRDDVQKVEESRVRDALCSEEKTR